MVMTYQTFGPWIYGQEWVVAKVMAPEESIQNVIDKITDASSTRRYRVEVMPGIFAEAVTMKQYVNVVSVGGNAVIKPPAAAATAVTMASDSLISGFTIDMSDGATTGVAVGNLTEVDVDNCYITGGGEGDIGITDASTGTSVRVTKCRVESVQYGYQKTGTGTTWFAGNRITSAIARVSMQGAVADDGGAQTDETTAANNDTPNDMTLIPSSPAVNDAYYFGGVQRFERITLNVGIAGVKLPGSWTITFEYSQGSGTWGALTVTDNTSEFTVAGENTITFTPPADWAKDTVFAISAYWVRARVSAATLPIGTQPKGTRCYVSDAIDIDVNLGTLSLMDNELMYAQTGANVDLAAAAAVVNSYGNTLAGDGWRIGSNANAKVYSHDDKFRRVEHAGVGFMVAFEEPQTYLVHNGMKIADALTDITAIGDASDAKRYTVKTFTGRYNESLTMLSYVDLVGDSPESVVLYQAAATVINLAANSRVRSLRALLTAGTGQAAILANDVAASLENVKVTVTRASGINYGVRTTGTAGLTAYDLDIYANHASDYAASFSGSGTHVIYDSDFENPLGYDIGVVSSTVTTFANNLRGLGWQIADAVTAIVRSHSDYFTAVSKGAAGIMTCQDKPNVWRVFNGMEIADAHTAASAGDTIEVGPGTYTEALAITKALTLVSLSGPEVTTIDQANANVVTISAAATIDGFTISVTAAAVARTGIVCTTFSPVIKNCIVLQAVTAGYGVTATTGSPLIEGCRFTSGLDMAVRQTGAGGTIVRKCTISSGATNGISSEGGTVYVYHSTISVVGNGLNANTGTIRAEHTSITGAVIDCNVAAASTIIVEECAYNDVTNLGTFVDLTGCREYSCLLGVTVGEWVYSSGVNDVAEAQANALATMPTMGVVVYKPTDTTCKVKNYGYVYDSAAPWVAGDEYWVSDAVAGAITNVMPAVWPQRAGVAVATNRFKILIGDNLGLVHTNVYENVGGAVVVGDWVYITAVDNEVAPAQANIALTMPAIGVVVEVIDATHCRVKLDGKYSEASRGWTASDDVYVDDTVAGNIVNVPPVMGIVQKVAEVKSDDGVTAIVYELA